MSLSLIISNTITTKRNSALSNVIRGNFTIWAYTTNLTRLDQMMSFSIFLAKY